MLIMIVGLPGSGKSTWISKNYGFKEKILKTIHVLSSDNAREELFGNVNDQTHNEEVFQFIKERATELLSNNYDVIIDATNLTRKNRKSITDYIEQKISGFYEWNYVKYVIMGTPYYKCLENNRKRERQVPEEVIERMYKNFEFPTYTETVHEIEIVYPFEIDKEMYGEEHPYRRYFQTSQDTPFHKFTLGNHLMLTYNIMELLTNNEVMLKAAELHDIGKPFCKTIDESGIAHYYNHANVGSYEAMFYGKIAKFDQRQIVELCNLIQFHMRIWDWDCDSEKAKKKLRDIVGTTTYHRLQLLNIADREAH